ncbi:MAG TPA: PepSY-associated TM helix domain-containing protein [Polyangiales bacterium]|nr:PepSY-associated TM helix domain-containing protein [Polyangiales bacterium]
MLESFRLSMAWVHTWFGLILGFVLMSVFFFGSLSVFDREIDRWVIPETRFDPEPMPSFDRVLSPIFARITPDRDELAAASSRVGKPVAAELPLKNWSVYTTHRDPVLTLWAEYAVDNPSDPEDHAHGHLTIDPRSGATLAGDQLAIGSQFFYPMHFGLHLEWLSLGYWIVGLAALSMLVALATGVVIHRKLFREIFTFRPEKNLQRSSLDLHNLTGVVALPFHFMFAFTGLFIFGDIYFPLSETMLKPVADAHQVADAAARNLPHAPAGVPAPLASVDAMVAEAKRRWAARGMPGEVGWLLVEHVGDANSYVTIYRAGSDRVTLVGQPVYFEGRTGKLLYEEPRPSAVSSVGDFLTGLHLQHFKHWLLRWFYLLGGLSGCVCIATGLVFFVNKRKRKHAAEGVAGARWADALAVMAVLGPVLAALSMLVANRFLPGSLAERGHWEQRVFWCAWLASFVHAAVRSAPVQQARLAPAWREQCWAVALLSAAAVLGNWITTGDHLLRTLAAGYWPVAGFDLALACTALIAALAAARLHRHERGVPLLDAEPVEAVHG